MFKRIKERYFTPKNENTVRFKRYMAKKIDGKLLKYVVERTEDKGDIVVGQAGSINVRLGFIYVVSGGKTVMISAVDETSVNELYSGDGVIITGFDNEDKREKSIIAFYVHYRK